MDIVYCSKCGKMVPPGGPDEGRHFLVTGEPVCPKCYRKIPADQHTGSTMTAGDPVGPRPGPGLKRDSGPVPRPRTSQLNIPAARRPSSALLEPAVASGAGRGGATQMLFAAGAVLALVGIGAWLLLGPLRGGPAGESDRAGRNSPATAASPGDRGRPDGGEPASRPTDTHPAPALDEAALRAAQAEAEEFWKKNPRDFSGAIERFERLRAAGRGSRWESAAEAAIAAVRMEREQTVEEALVPLRAKADALAASGDFDGAGAVFGEPSGDLAAELVPRYEAERARLAARADERLAAILAAARKCSADGEPDQGLLELAKAAAFKCAAWTEPLAAMRARLEAEKADARATAERKLRAEADRALGELLDGFETRVLAGNCAGAAEFLYAERQRIAPEQLKLVSGRIEAAERVAAALKEEEARRRRALAGLAGRKVALKLADGHTLSGQVLETTANGLRLEVTQREGIAEIVRKQDVLFGELARGEIERLAPFAKLSGADGQMAAGALLIAAGDAEGAEKALAAAGDHPLAPRWAERLDAIRLGAGEAAAKHAWAALLRSGLIRGKYDEFQSRALAETIGDYLAAHGKSAFAREHAAEIAEANLVGRVRGLFKGRLASFAPKTLEAELRWDFADAGQISDFEISGGEWKIENGALRGETRAKDDKQTLWTRARFAPGCRVSCDGALIRDRCLAVILGSPADYVGVEMALGDLMGAPVQTIGLIGRGTSWGPEGTHLAGRREPALALGKRFALELIVDGAASSGKLGDGPALTGKGFECQSLRAGLRVYPSEDAGGKPRVTVAQFRDLRVAGRLDRAWLERALRGDARPAIPNNGLLAHWTFDKIAGDSVPDASGRGHDGKLFGGAKPGKGRLGDALQLAGGLMGMEVPNAPELEVGKNDADFSVTFWLFLEEPAARHWRALIRKGSAYEQRTFAIWLKPNTRQIYYRLSTKKHYDRGGTGTSDIPLARWVHAAYVKRGTNLAIYLDGRQDSVTELTEPVASNADPIRVGAVGDYVAPKCRIDDVRIYGRALTEKELAALATDAGKEAAPAPSATPAGGAFKETGGLAVMEAEDFNDMQPAVATADTPTWVKATDKAGFVGAAALQATPKDKRMQLNLGAGARLDYRVIFEKAGDYRVWLRMANGDSECDTVFFGLDDAHPKKADSIRGLQEGWHWTSADGRIPASIRIEKPGEHVLHLWIRESRVHIDRIVLAADPAFTPDGDGPAESQRIEPPASAPAK